MMKRVLSFGVAAFIVCGAGAVSAQDPTSLELQNQYSGKCLAVKGASSLHGAQLVHKDCGTGDLETIWELTFDSGKGGYQIRNMNSRMCLGIEHGDAPWNIPQNLQSLVDGRRVTQVNSCDRHDTTWLIETPGGVSLNLPFPYGEPVIVRNSNGRCLALVTGTDIKEYGCPPHRPKTTWRFLKSPVELPDPGSAQTVVSQITFSPSGVEPASALLGSRDKPGTRAAINFLSTDGWTSDYDFVRIQHTFTLPPGSRIVQAFLRVRMEDDGDVDMELLGGGESARIRTETGSDARPVAVADKVNAPAQPGPADDYVLHFTAEDFKHFADGRFIVNIRAHGGDFYLHESVLTVVYYPSRR